MSVVVDLTAYRARRAHPAHPAGSALPDDWYYEAAGYRPGLWRIGNSDVGHVVYDVGNGAARTRCELQRATSQLTRAAGQRPCKSCVPP